MNGEEEAEDRRNRPNPVPRFVYNDALAEIKRLRQHLIVGRELSRELLHHAEPEGWYAAELRSKFRAWLELVEGSADDVV